MVCSTQQGPSTSKLTVRHSFSTNYISTLNKQLTQEQQALISGTPFCWFLDLIPKVRLARNILSELVVKWVDSSDSFLIRDKLLPLIEKDFCLGLGLSTDGKDLNLKENYKRSSCVKYVGKDTKDLELVYKCIMRKREKKIPCSDFCSLYILVGISELLFPNRSGRVFPLLYEIVDNLSGLGNFCWGSLVYRYLVRSLCNASDRLKKGKGTSNFYIDGCTYMLQVWFCENFIPPKGQIHKSPRILHWMNVHLGDNVVKKALESGEVDHDFDDGAMNDDKDEQPSLKMKVEKPPSTKKILKRKLKESVMRTMEHQQNLVAELKREVLQLEQEVAYEKARRRRPKEGGQSVPRKDPSFSPEGISPGGMSTDPTPMKTDPAPMKTDPTPMKTNPAPLKTFVRKGSRRRVKSRALRTPFTGTLRIKDV